MYKSVIFDIGDTLVYREPDLADMVCRRLNMLGLLANKEQGRRIKKTVDLWIGEQIMRERAGSARMPDDEFKRNTDKVIFEKTVEMYPDIHLSLSELEKMDFQTDKRLIIAPDTLPVLDYLSRRNYKLGIVSNYDPAMAAFLSENGVTGYFGSVVISGVVGVEKPDVKIMEIALHELGCRADECIYVGDHPLDVLCAKAAGMAMAWLCDAGDVLPDYVKYKADYQISGLRDLEAIL